MPVKNSWKTKLVIMAAAVCLMLPRPCLAAPSAVTPSADEEAETVPAEETAPGRGGAANIAPSWPSRNRKSTSGSGRNISETEREPVILTEETESCLESLDLFISPEAADASKEPRIEILGEGKLLPEYEKRLRTLLDETEKNGFHIGIVMIDIHTGKGISVNGTREFYSASSIKGPFVVSLAALLPETLATRMNTFRAVTVNSDNNAYGSLVTQYGKGYYTDWCTAAGADTPLNMGFYASVTAEELARLWLLDYQYIRTNRINGETVGKLFETPNRSAIRAVLEGRCRTQTKAGWIGERVNAAADAGVVYAAEGPYVLSITSDYRGTLNRLEPYVALMHEIHAAMTGTKIRPIQ